MTSPYTAPNVLKLRAAGSGSAAWHLSVPTLGRLKLWSGRVNGLIARGVNTIEYDTGAMANGGSFADIMAGQLLTVDTVRGTPRLRVKSITGDATAGEIKVNENNVVGLIITP